MAAPGYQCFCGFDTTPTSCTNITRASTDGGDEQARASYREAESNVTEGTVYHDVNAIKENFAETLYEAKEGFVPVSVAVLVPDQPHRTSPSGKGNRGDTTDPRHSEMMIDHHLLCHQNPGEMHRC